MVGEVYFLILWLWGWPYDFGQHVIASWWVKVTFSFFGFGVGHMTLGNMDISCPDIRSKLLICAYIIGFVPLSFCYHEENTHLLPLMMEKTLKLNHCESGTICIS